MVRKKIMSQNISSHLSSGSSKPVNGGERCISSVCEANDFTERCVSRARGIPTEDFGQSSDTLHEKPSNQLELKNQPDKKSSTESAASSPCEGQHSTGASDECQSDNDQSQSLEPDIQLMLLHSKHKLLVRLMHEVYSIFDQRWNARLQSRTGGTPNTSPVSSQASPGRRPNRRRKRSRDDRDSTPPEGHSKRLRVDDDPSSKAQEDRLFACPFHKYDRHKYSCNSVNGSKYRSCVGPGFLTIARLKQHLKRVHSAPQQCTRCWLIVTDLQALTNHANEEVRCERRDPRPEGISTEKMTLITSKWGATWDQIYSILFPGAPLPSPYHDQEISEGAGGHQSPQSQDLANFEAYTRVELPRLVEARLQSIVNAEVTPLEDSLRATIVDIVRQSQSTVAENYNRVRTTPPVTTPRMNDSASYTPLLRAGSNDVWGILQHPQNTQEDGGSLNNTSAMHYEEPPFWTQTEDDLFSVPESLLPMRHPLSASNDSGFQSYPQQIIGCVCLNESNVAGSRSQSSDI
ncbi:MAG: hypothetical protein Q9222_003400 [Ikaeria aurantiellina]